MEKICGHVGQRGFLHWMQTDLPGFVVERADLTSKSFKLRLWRNVTIILWLFKGGLTLSRRNEDCRTPVEI